MAMGEDEATRIALTVPGLCCERELRFLYRLALKAPEGLPFVDLGTYQGRTAAILATTGHRVITIDNYIQDSLFRDQASLHPADHAEAVAERLHDLGFNIQIVIGESAMIPPGIDRIGLLFIDSEHTRRCLYKEFGAWLPLLVKGGILALHDYVDPRPGQTMRPVIDTWIRNKTDEWEYLGLAVWLVAFRRLK